jgi:hypothetical protein
MRIIGGLDVHRRQITYNYLDLRTGEEHRRMIKPASREEVRSFLQTLGRKKAAFALEGTIGWRFIAEELRRAGIEVHLAEPAETRDRRGSKRRAKTDRTDARLRRQPRRAAMGLGSVQVGEWRDLNPVTGLSAGAQLDTGWTPT